MKYTPVGAALGVLCLAMPAQADPLPRPSPAAGSVIARKSGEEVRFVDISGWRYVDLQQALLSGDVLRTNATGQLAVLFSDRTQVRLGRNTSLLVKRMGGTGDTGLELQSGTIWARAERGGQGVVIDTPAAAAAIRGTDWTMTVGADGKTSLIVLDGVVELSNAQGSVTVSQGEGAVAAIGQKPSKIVIAKPKDREQMLFNLSLRSAFQWMPATPLIVPQMRKERDRLEAEEAGARSAEDWLSLSEIYLSLEGKEKAKAALNQARAQGLRGSQIARANLIDALIAGSENRYRDAAALFEKARPGLDAKRSAIAAYGGYFARSLADPNHVEQPPRLTNSGYAGMAKAWTAGFREDIPAALEVIKESERNTPGDPTLPGARAQLGIMLADEKEVVDGFERALAIDPDDPTGLEARANYKLFIRSDRQGALDDLNRALRTAPGSSSIWNTIGLAQSDRDANREAEAAYKKAIELDPLDPVSHANLALLYLTEGRMAEAKHEIDEALRVDPSFDIGLIARGRYYLQRGEMDKAVQDLLAGSTANPGYSQGQLMLAAALYEKGDRIPAAQALDNAGRLDPHDPVIASVRTSMAIHEYDSDNAIRYAQEFLRLGRARGGDFISFSANQSAGSVLNDAFRLQGLDAWGQYYGDAVFDPFTGTSYLDQSVHGSVNPFANTYAYGGNATDYVQNGSSYSSFIQALMLDPHMLASSERTLMLVNSPFIETSLGGGFNTSGSDTDWLAEGQVQGYANAVFPVSFNINARWETTPFSGRFPGDLGYYDGSTEVKTANGYLTASPTPDDRIVFYANYLTDNFLQNTSLFSSTPAPITYLIDRDDESRTTGAGIGWSHTIEHRNIVNLALFYGDERADIGTTLGTDLGSLSSIDTSKQRTYIAAINHTLGYDDLTWRYGLEGGWADTYFRQEINGIPLYEPLEGRYDIGKAYVDVLHDISSSLRAEYALFGTYISGENVEVSRLEPRAGLAWTPIEGHWLRAAYMRESYDFSAPTLSPIGVVGIQPNAYGIGLDGRADTIALRWDAEWSDRFFTAVDFQHQDLHKVSIAFPQTSPLPYIPGSALGTAFQTDEGRIDRASLTANLAVGHGFGLSGTIARTSSEDQDPASLTFGDSLPFIPETSGQAAITWVNQANIKVMLAANYVGKRDTGLKTKLDGYWTIDGNLTWEPFDKRFVLELAAYNLLDEEFDVAPLTPGWGRSFRGSLKVRF
ncbi:FecR domain-containing protein [Rhizobium sp. Root1204]|uniref:FecR domain-containing protein n=1 Tax=unclassified Rhizobium TaxID=2613769 RepID=UPI0007150D1B|nr:FecR domain-containing protein [Rhizobium sp. Root1204]KQV39296.1 TonB-dependent receptor [Rhizobium sp. Root1204]